MAPSTPPQASTGRPDGGTGRSAAVVIGRDGLEALIRALAGDGRRVIGPVLRDGAICYAEIAGVADLPEGWTDRQEPGAYRLERRGDRALFGYAVGPHSWKQFLHPPRVREWRARRTSEGLTISPEPPPGERYAFLGVRACELAAIAVQDRVFLGAAAEPVYQALRSDLFIVAVNCSHAAATCFCASMGTGPRAQAGYDLALTELPDGRFLLEAASEAGLALSGRLPHEAACAGDRDAAAAVSAATERAITRRMPTAGLKEALQGQPEHPRWDDVAARCLACGNCTSVCPTCFCTTAEDVTDLVTGEAEHLRRWDSCFTSGFSYVHGGSVRSSVRSRYRQWLTHKLAHWIDQFGTSGCVGCGRCIAWCPAGIDITAEAEALQAQPGKSPG